MSHHKIVKCGDCKSILLQCRCPGPHAIEYVAPPKDHICNVKESAPVTSPFARVERKEDVSEIWIGGLFVCDFKGARPEPEMSFYCADALAKAIDDAFHARCAPLVEALENIGKRVRVEHLELAEIARKTLEEFRK